MAKVRNIDISMSVPWLYRGTSNVPSPLIILLHGYGGNMEQMMRISEDCIPSTFGVASVQGPHQHTKPTRIGDSAPRVGFGWGRAFSEQHNACVHHRILDTVISALVEEHLADPDNVFLLGFSEPVPWNYQYALSGRNRIRGVVGVCGELPRSRVSNTTHTAILHVCGSSDPHNALSVAFENASYLKGNNVEVEIQVEEGAHEFNAGMKESVKAWLGSSSAKQPDKSGCSVDPA
jgi:predicted esterase